MKELRKEGKEQRYRGPACLKPPVRRNMEDRYLTFKFCLVSWGDLFPLYHSQQA